VGQVLQLLKELDIDGETIVIFTSDNGGEEARYGHDPQADFFNANGPLRGFKYDLYEGGIRVPMIVRWPGKIEAGRVSDHVGHFADIMPTLCELAGADSPVTDGYSLVPTLTGEGTPKTHEYLYWEHHFQGQFRRAVRWGKWKAVQWGLDFPLELYNLEEDVGEQDDVAESHPDIVAKCEAMMKKARTAPREQIEPSKPRGKGWR
jgi:arylsulfatase A-like enzyme